MQLAPITEFPVLAPIRAAAPTPATSTDAPARLEPAAPTAPAPVESAVDGASRLSQPLVDFPGIVAGDRFAIVKGSKVGFLGVKGDAEVTRLTDDDATFKIKAGAFGIKVDVVVDVVRTGPDTVRISSRGSGIPDTDAEGRIVEQRTNHVVFERISDPSERTVIDHDGDGRIEIDTVIPVFGQAHLVLQRRD